MLIDIQLNSIGAKAASILLGLTVCALLTIAALVSLAVGMLTDERANVSRELLATGVSYVPYSASLNGRLAQAELEQPDRDLKQIEDRARQAVNQSPWDYRQRLRLATVLEASGNRTGALQSLQEAVSLAPNYTEVHWRLANLLLREGKLTQSVREFRRATTSNPAFLPSTLDLLWRVSAGNLAVVQAVTPDNPKSRVLLAQFLIKQSRGVDAITTLARVDRNSLAELPQSAELISSLLSAGLFRESRGLWGRLVGGSDEASDQPLPEIWNGDFESEISKKLPHFDWSITRNEHAIAGIDSATAHSGNRSLRIDFPGRDTTRLDGQVKQSLILNPGIRYRLEYYVKTERLETPSGPRVVITAGGSSTELVSSEPVPAGSSDWRRVTVDFIVPANTRSATITIKRIPKFSYDEPTRGTVWFDDFALNEEKK